MALMQPVSPASGNGSVRASVPDGEAEYIPDRRAAPKPLVAAYPLISYVIPIRNESGSVEHLLGRLTPPDGGSIEVVFVDDSDDATPYKLRLLAKANTNPRVEIRLVHRTHKQREGGLGSAVCEGIRRAKGTWICVLDADLQHPPELISELLASAARENADIVVGSRYAPGGSRDGLSRNRRVVSRGCASAARAMFPVRLREVSDPLSGYFLLRRSAIDPDILHPDGFKILLEILARNPDLSVVEVGFAFSERYAGVSKASVREGARYLRQLGHLRADTWKRPGKQKYQFRYDVHGILSVESCGLLPELEQFRVRSLDGLPSIRVDLKRFDRTENGELIDLDHAVPKMQFNETFGNNGFSIEVELGDTVRVCASPFVLRSPHVLYTNVVEPLLRWKFVEQGYALVHAACFVDGDEAHLVTARTDTGKTTTMLKILELGQYRFLSDDLSLIDAEGRVLTYPKPLTISNHTVHALQSAELGRIERMTLPVQSRLHSKSGREFALFLAEKEIPIATINAMVQRLVPPPKYHIGRLVPGVGIASSAVVRSLSIIQRGEDQQLDLQPDQALDILLENCEDAYGFPPYSSLAALVHTCSDMDLVESEHDIIRSALRNVPSRLYGSSSLGWAQDIHDDITNRPEVLDA